MEKQAIAGITVMKDNADNGWDENVRLLEELKESRRLIDG
jgi:hypothetical protein